MNLCYHCIALCNVMDDYFEWWWHVCVQPPCYCFWASKFFICQLPDVQSCMDKWIDICCVYTDFGCLYEHMMWIGFNWIILGPLIWSLCWTLFPPKNKLDIISFPTCKFSCRLAVTTRQPLNLTALRFSWGWPIGITIRKTIPVGRPSGIKWFPCRCIPGGIFLSGNRQELFSWWDLPFSCLFLAVGKSLFSGSGTTTYKL